MKIRGNTVGASTPRADFLQTDPLKPDYIKNKPPIVASGNVEPSVPALWFNTSPASEANPAARKGVFTMKDADSVLLYPVTTMEAIYGLEEHLTEEFQKVNETIDGKIKTFSVTLSSGGWTGNAAPYTQKINVTGILATDRPHYSAVYSDDQATRLDQKEGFSLVDDLDTADGSVTFTCFEEKPAVDIPVQMEVYR